MGGYLSYTYRGKTVSVMPGLRYEYTYQDIKYLAGPIGAEGNYSSHYANVVPSVRVNLKLAKAQSLRLEAGTPQYILSQPLLQQPEPAVHRAGQQQPGCRKQL